MSEDHSGKLTVEFKLTVPLPERKEDVKEWLEETKAKLTAVGEERITAALDLAVGE